MRQKSFYLLLLLATIFTWSCQKEADVFAPVISGTEVDTVLNIGDKLVLAPNITNLVGVGYTWLVNGKEVASGQTDYTFTATEPGNFVVTFRAANKGGQGEQMFKIMVEKPIAIILENELTIPMSKVLDIEPTVSGPERNDYRYEWAIGDSIIGNAATLEFISINAGDFTLTLTATAGKQSATAACEVTVEEAEYSGYVTSLLEYQPSPMASFNWTRLTGNTKSFLLPYDEFLSAISEHITERRTDQLVIGDWGGYAVFGFDHTVANVPGKTDIQVYVADYYPDGENAFFIAYDKNKNGKPDDDEWYEIKNSNYGKENIKDYEVTFTFKNIDIETNQQVFEWEDNQGEKGEVTRRITPSSNAGFFPGYTLKNGEVHLVDGWKSSFTLKAKRFNKRYHSANKPVLLFNIDINNAVNEEGQYVYLPGVDFLKVQNTRVMYWQQNTEQALTFITVSRIKNNHL